MSDTHTHDSLRIAIIGAGPARLATGHELLAKGFTSFTIYEATSYYRSADGRAPFLFPGDFKLYAKLHAESTRDEYDEVA